MKILSPLNTLTRVHSKSMIQLSNMLDYDIL